MIPIITAMLIALFLFVLPSIRKIRRGMQVWATRCTGIVNLALPYDVAFKHALASIHASNGIVGFCDRDAGVINGYVPLRWWYAGDSVRIELKRCTDQQTGITVISRPISSAPLASTRNHDHVQRITRFLESVSDAYNEGHQA